MAMKMSRKTCATCIYWKPLEFHFTGKFRQCTHSKIRKEFTLIDLPLEFFESDEAVVEYDEEWGILTGPEFGCIHHVLKEVK